MMLKRSFDRKVSPVISGGRAKIANSFGLPAGISCPGKTSICGKVCYAGKLEVIYKGVLDVLMHNWNTLQSGNMQQLIDEMIVDFVKDCNKADVKPVFRIHWDGDFYSLDYAEAWASAIRKHSNVNFWVYTRSFTDKLNVIPALSNLPNLAVYLSVDSENAKYASEIVQEHPWVKVAALAQTMHDAEAIMLTMRDRPGAKCPENVKSIPLFTEKGGACVTCKLCIDGKVDVRFAIGKR